MKDYQRLVQKVMLQIHDLVLRKKQFVGQLKRIENEINRVKEQIKSIEEGDWEALDAIKKENDLATEKALKHQQFMNWLQSKKRERIESICHPKRNGA